MFDENNTQQENSKVTVDVKVTRAVELKGKNTVMFDCIANGITIYGMSLHQYTNGQGEKGFTINFPSRQDAQDPAKYWKYAFFPITKELKDNIIDQIKKMV